MKSQRIEEKPEDRRKAWGLKKDLEIEEMTGDRRNS